MKTYIKKGVIISFDLAASRGKILVFRSGKKIKFHSTCFQSDPPTRFPKLGEIVEMTFSDNKLISVHSA